MFEVTNPVDVTKVRMQLDGELAKQRGQLTQAYRQRHYKGIFRGALTIAKEEGVLGLYKGWVYYCVISTNYQSIKTIYTGKYP